MVFNFISLGETFDGMIRNVKVQSLLLSYSFTMFLFNLYCSKNQAFPVILIWESVFIQEVLARGKYFISNLKL